MKAKMDNGHFVFSPRERGEVGKVQGVNHA